LEDGLRLLAVRGFLMSEVPGGSMLSVRLSATELRKRLPAVPCVLLHQKAARGPWVAPDPRACVQPQEGMVLALEPHVNFWHLQDMVLVTKGAIEQLKEMFA
jgi:hypothetical protein